MRFMRRSSLILTVVGVFGCGSDETTAGDNLVPIVGTDGGQGGADGGLVGFDAGTIVGSDGGGGGTGGNQDGTCERKTVSAGPVVPDIMIVLDRSGSMKPDQGRPGLNCKNPDPLTGIFCSLAGIDCNDPTYQNSTVCGGSSQLDRWTPAVNGLKSITAQLDDRIRFGLTTFPAENDNGCKAGVEKVEIGLDHGDKIAAALMNTSPGGATPTGPTLQAVRSKIEMKGSTPDNPLPPQYVLLVTDGQPMCQGVNESRAKQDAIKAIDDLKAAGVKTYVIGYDASVNAALAMSLKEFAMHGGTGDFFPVQDEASLVAKFKEITGAVASCSYQLEKAPQDPKFVKVTIDGEQVRLGQGLTIDGPNVTIEGATCEKLRDGKSHLVDVSVECVSQVLQ